jgi:hypothetical protein
MKLIAVLLTSAILLSKANADEFVQKCEIIRDSENKVISETCIDLPQSTLSNLGTIENPSGSDEVGVRYRDQHTDGRIN